MKTKHTGSLLFLFTLLSINLIAQAPYFQWAHQMGGSSGWDVGTSIISDPLGNICVGGSFKGTADFDPDTVVLNLVSKGLYDIFIQKFDPTGNLIWVKHVGGTKDDNLYCIASDSYGNIYSTGFFYGNVDFDPGPGVTNLNSDPIRGACFILKLDMAGNLIWAKKISGTGGTVITSIKTDAVGHTYTTGYFNNTVDFDPNSGIFNLTSAGGTDIFVQKLDSNGNLIWCRQLSGTKSGQGESIALDVSGNIYTTGHFERTFDFDPGSGLFNFTCRFICEVYICFKTYQQW